VEPAAQKVKHFFLLSARYNSRLIVRRMPPLYRDDRTPCACKRRESEEREKFYISFVCFLNLMGLLCARPKIFTSTVRRLASIQKSCQPSRSKNRANPAVARTVPISMRSNKRANPAVARTVPTRGGNETHSHLGRPRSPTRTTL